MNTVLIESGSSKSSWILLFDKKIIKEFTLAGINPSTQSKSSILSLLEIAKQNLGDLPTQAIYFYGAGCKGMAQIMMQELLNHCFITEKIEVHSDLLAAARSSCNGKEGIVCILGTGSHSCLSDGHVITHERPSLGYLLGDEGSGNFYGKLLLQAYFYKMMNSSLDEKFIESFPFVREEYLSQLYSSPRISFELAQFFPFLINNKNEALIQEIINTGIRAFYEARLKEYEPKNSIPVYIVGNVGNQLKLEYLQFLEMKGFKQIYFNPLPIADLINYHNKYV